MSDDSAAQIAWLLSELERLEKEYSNLTAEVQRLDGELAPYASREQEFLWGKADENRNIVEGNRAHITLFAEQHQAAILIAALRKAAPNHYLLQHSSIDPSRTNISVEYDIHFKKMLPEFPSISPDMKPTGGVL